MYSYNSHWPNLGEYQVKLRVWTNELNLEPPGIYPAPNMWIRRREIQVSIKGEKRLPEPGNLCYQPGFGPVLPVENLLMLLN